MAISNYHYNSQENKSTEIILLLSNKILIELILQVNHNTFNDSYTNLKYILILEYPLEEKHIFFILLMRENTESQNSSFPKINEKVFPEIFPGENYKTGVEN